MSSPPRTLRLCLSYDGRDFHGWQVQPGLATIQGVIEAALESVIGERVLVHGSGRTDAGVHALGQVAHIQLDAKRWARLPAANLMRALNARLPRSIRIWGLEEAAPDFHARRDAVSKLYRYRMYREAICPPFLRDYVYHHPYPLLEEKMIAAAPAFVGCHDFRSFAATPDKHLPPLENTVRTVYFSGLRREGEELIYEVSGRGFLHHMVRNMVGFLLEVGRGIRQGAEIPAVLAARRRRSAGPTAPPQGLYLVRVAYSENMDEAARP